MFASTLLALALGQGCTPEWLPLSGAQPGTEAPQRAMAFFDDGTGAALYVGGEFQFAGAAPASGIARWDGTTWSAVGTGLVGPANSKVSALCVFDDGAGPSLYAGGTFTAAPGVPGTAGIARWDGAGWHSVGGGVDGEVAALLVYDDGSGPALYAGGDFTSAGQVAASRIARWDGLTWTALGAGTSAKVLALAEFDDGTGSALYVGGQFNLAGGAPANRIARWSGGVWSPLGAGLSGDVRALLAFDDGSGSALYVGGAFGAAVGTTGTRCVARWNGVQWSSVGGGITGGVGLFVDALSIYDSGAGPALHAGGQFTSIGGIAANRIARWNGVGWFRLANGTDGPVHALSTFTDAAGLALYVGGDFQIAGEVGALRSARWDGSAFGTLGLGPTGAVEVLQMLDVGSGPALYAAGAFASVAGVPKTRGVARFDGISWQAIGQGIQGNVLALTTFDGGGVPTLYAGGEFFVAAGGPANRITRWNGTSWVGVGGGTNQPVRALVSFDDGSGEALYVGGSFTLAGVVQANRIARWNGVAWSSVGAGMDQDVYALAVYDDGAGPALYAGGAFTVAGGTPANRIARWDGATWSAVGSGVNLPVRVLAPFDDGTGEVLVLGGSFTLAGGDIASRIARWDGANFSSFGLGLAGGPSPSVRALAAFDDGSGLALYAGGDFTQTGIQPVARLARWGGTQWNTPAGPIEGGLPPAVRALAVGSAGTAQDLFVGGEFASSPGGDSNLARWRGCPVLGFATLLGCASNPAQLSAQSPGLKVGVTADLQLAAGAGTAGLGLLLVGVADVDASGCGSVVDGLGEILLAAPWFQVGFATASSGVSAFSVPVPNDALLVGLELAFQGAHVDLAPLDPVVQLSNALLGAATP
ncbi:MAG: hypothetical protein GC161_13860 [Planctomycetaceae bacterium]|nr:hypothetical protein [Planctomycetaceae bacterium]